MLVEDPVYDGEFLESSSSTAAPGGGVSASEKGKVGQLSNIPNGSSYALRQLATVRDSRILG